MIVESGCQPASGTGGLGSNRGIGVTAVASYGVDCVVLASGSKRWIGGGVLEVSSTRSKCSLRSRQSNEPRGGLAAPAAAAPERVMVLVSDTALRSGDLLVKLGLSHFAAVACLRNLGGDACPSTAAGPGAAPAPLRFGAALLP